jgi:hypothetical protein
VSEQLSRKNKITMNLKAIAATAAVLVAGSPLAASAQTTAPVAIADSQIQQSYGIFSDFAYPGLVTVSFVNNRNVPATEVDLNVEANGQVVDSFQDVGTFSKGVTIRHNFQTQATNLDQKVTVASVTYADGTTWSNEDAAPRTLRQADISFVGDILAAGDLFPNK